VRPRRYYVLCVLIPFSEVWKTYKIKKRIEVW